MKPTDKVEYPQGASCTIGKGAASQEADLGIGARIYGKEGCPHTSRARAALPRARFVDVLADPASLEEMLRLSGGVRRVPVIVRKDGVEIGFRRGS
ncbi:Glutaredoxin [Humidesulfovibrio mexicanus]|uniref:Glutaredoxin n=1 Tax=Humidesulfovibrio mexicanus TaxID=147047 RepID=A0A238Y5J2_9BACT|nr:Glutaredoxin [Humidesulfovibrio mexicanus]